MECLKCIITIFLGIVIIISALGIIERFRWGNNSDKDPLIIYIPLLLVCSGIVYYVQFVW